MAAVFGDHDAEMRADFVGPGKQRHHLFRAGGSGDVVVLRRVAEQAVAHATARKQRLVARRDEAAGKLGGGIACGHGPTLHGIARRIKKDRKV